MGSQFTVGCRFLADECIDGGSDAEDAAYFAVRFAQAGMDFLSLSRGGKFDDARQPKVGEAAYPYTGRSGYECMPSYFSDRQGPFGRNLEPTARIRAAVRASGARTPVVAAGGIHNFAQAEAVLASGQADIIALARQALADPDWFRKVAGGHGARCGCASTPTTAKHSTSVTARSPASCGTARRLDEPGVARSADGKRRLTPPRWEP